MHGIHGTIYNLVSSVNTQVNARFVFISAGRCPANVKSTCWTHPGSYLGAIGIQQRVDEFHLYQLEMQSGSADSGFSHVSLNGKNLSIGTYFQHSTLEIEYSDNFMVLIKTDEFEFTMTNSDGFINQQVLPRRPLSQLNTHGLFGQTHCRQRYNSTLKVIEGEVEDYAINESTLFGVDFVFNRFQN